ncbi:MAG TPA: hypothetical protein VGR27_08505 [Longimicrobiaceae bacterium]|nr:hypothetical protein [Longimicrobiaceae bacterium]
MQRLRITLILLAGVFGAGCAPSAAGNGTQRTSEVITAEEIATVEVNNALEAVQRLRPQLLRSRGTATVRSAGPEGQRTVIATTSGTELAVYVDDVRMGGVEARRNLSARRVREIRYVNARDATTRYGTGHVGASSRSR